MPDKLWISINYCAPIYKSSNKIISGTENLVEDLYQQGLIGTFWNRQNPTQNYQFRIADGY